MLHAYLQVTICRQISILADTFSSVELIDCGALPNPANGMVTITPGLVTLTSVEAVATYACGEGYNLVGDTMRTCQATGQWNGTAPTCIGKYHNNNH